MPDYSEILCESIKIVGESLLEGLKFDQTIECTITDIDQAEKGIYRVSNGSTTFLAYSSERYSKGTNVYVMIPKGDYNNDKLIIGKVASLNSEPYNYVAPLDNLLDITGNIVSLEDYNSKKGLLANDDRPGGESKLLFTLEPTNNSYNGYTRLGLRASFQSWLYESKCISGDYGLRLDIECEAAAESNGENSTTYLRQLYLNTEDMVGNPYQFESYYSQEKLFDISALDSIKSIKVYFCQKSGSFKNDKGNLIPFKNEELDDYYFDNLFVSNISIYLGFDASEATGDFVRLNSSNSLFYKGENNLKIINLLWLHEDSKGIKYKMEGSTDEYEIRWYYYEFGQPGSDGYGGVNWLRTTPEDSAAAAILRIEDDKSFHATLSPRSNFTAEQVKVVILYGTPPGYYKYEGAVTKDDYDYAPEEFFVLTAEGYKNPAEYIEDVDYYYYLPESRDIYKSNIITFSNEEEISEDIDIFGQLNALSLICQDVLEYKNDKYITSLTYGNYLLYDERNSLIDNAQASIERQVGCQLIPTGETTPISTEQWKNAKITWRYPTVNTMITPMIEGTSEEGNSDVGILIVDPSSEDDSNPVQQTPIEKQINNYGYPIFSYTIGRYFSMDRSNNWIQCIVEYNGLTYSAIQHLNFGQANTMGSDYTFVLNFKNDITAITVGEGENAENIEVEAHLYDSNNREIKDLSNYEITWSWFKSPPSNLLSQDPAEDRSSSIRIITGHGDITNLDGQAYILQASISLVVNETADKAYTITTYLPIPLRLSKDYVNISGADKIIYLSDGSPQYYREAYVMYKKENESIIKLYGNGAKEYKSIDEYQKNITTYYWYQTTSDTYIEISDVSETDFQSVWQGIKDTDSSDNKIYILEKDHGIWCRGGIINLEEDILYNLPDLITTDDYTARKIKKVKLNPAPFYTENMVSIPAAVFKENGEVKWITPILIIQNKYFSSMINNWDDKQLVIDKETNSILTNRIGAGTKNSENKFTGVLMGDWKDYSELGNILSRKTGLFGFQDGIQTFGFLEDGTATVGSATGGQICIDGGESTIQSASYKEDGTGMILNLRAPSLILQNKENINKYFIKMDASENNLNPTDKALSIGTDNNPNFSVDWQGNLYAKTGTFGGSLQAASGTFRGTLTSTTLEGATIKANSLIESSTIKGANIIGAKISGGIYNLYLNQNVITSSSLNYSVVTSWNPKILVYYFKWKDTGKYDAIDIQSQEAFDAVWEAVKDTSTMDGNLYIKNESSSTSNYSWEGIFNFYESETGGLVAKLGGIQGETFTTSTPSFGFTTSYYTSGTNSMSYYPSFIIESANAIRLSANGTKISTSDTLPAGRTGGIYLEATGTDIWFRSSSFPQTSTQEWYKLGYAYFG